MKEIKLVGYTVEVVFDRNWKVIVKYNGREQYFYICNNEQEAIEKQNKIRGIQ